ncbi:papain-like cysteine protease family protein [Azospirillum sp. sgz302134]
MEHRLSVLAAASALALAAWSLPSPATAEPDTGPEMGRDLGNVDLGIPNIRQDSASWCWVATAKQLIRWEIPDFDLPQCRMLEIAKNVAPGECCDHPDRCQEDGTLLGIGYLVELFTGIRARPAPVYSVERIHALLKRGHPVVLALQNGPEQGHAVVLRGIEYMQTMRDAVPILLLNDPISADPGHTERFAYEQLQPQLAGGVVLGTGR